MLDISSRTDVSLTNDGFRWNSTFHGSRNSPNESDLCCQFAWLDGWDLIKLIKLDGWRTPRCCGLTFEWHQCLILHLQKRENLTCHRRRILRWGCWRTERMPTHSSWGLRNPCWKDKKKGKKREWLFKCSNRREVLSKLEIVLTNYIDRSATLNQTFYLPSDDGKPSRDPALDLFSISTSTFPLIWKLQSPFPYQGKQKPPHT